MVRFLSVNARPTITRKLSRAVPQPISRAIIGRYVLGALNFFGSVDLKFKNTELA